MSPLDRTRQAVTHVTRGAGRAVNRAQGAVDTAAGQVRNAAGQVRNAAVEGGRWMGQAVDSFEKGTRAVGRTIGFGNQPDRVHDGKFVGAGGQTFLPGTALSRIPAITPRNNPKATNTVLFVNGILTPLAEQNKSLQAIAETTGSRVIGIHNSTEGMATDLAECVQDKLGKGRNPAVDTLADTLYTEITSGRGVHLMGHSQGGLISCRALGDVRKRLLIEDKMTPEQAKTLMSRIKVETFGAAAMRYPDGPVYVHYVNRADPVAGLVGLGPASDRRNPLVDGGQGSRVHHFNELSVDAHSFDSMYLKRRVPFEQARAGNFKR